jgi:hypothetical protein
MANKICETCGGTGEPLEAHESDTTTRCHVCNGSGVVYDPAVTARKAGVDLGGNPLPKREPIEGIITAWVPMSDPAQIALFSKLGEEAAELAKACSRAVMQGLDGTSPGQEGRTNAEEIFREHYDIQAALRVIRDEGWLPELFGFRGMQERYHSKIRGFRHWLTLIRQGKHE